MKVSLRFKVNHHKTRNKVSELSAVLPTPKIAAKNLADFNPAIFTQDLLITGVKLNAQAIQPGDLFIALPGAKTHGLNFADLAIKNGAVAILSDKSQQAAEIKVPHFVASNPRELVGEISAWLYDSPFKSLIAVGITGTNGKTTTSNLVKQLWQLAGLSAGVIGTLGVEVGSDKFESSRTTPEASDLQSIAAMMVQKNVSHLAMEVSSHALELGRVNGAHFQIGAFSNLTQDHLDFHGNMESYYLAKAKLFDQKLSNKMVVNIDDPYGKRLQSEVKNPIITVARQSKTADWSYTSYESQINGYKLSISHLGVEVINCDYNLLGEYNLDNLLLAVAIVFETGLTASQIEQVIPLLQSIPGRLEKLELGQSFNAVIDYAHTPDAVDRVLKSAQAFTSGKVIAVLGCGGDRDQSKRAIMGNSLLIGSDVAIFTSDNPRGESAEAILLQMVGDNQINTPNMVVTDRRDAIAYAVSVAEQGDTVLVLGKGHETGQEINGEVHPFDDFIELESAIKSKIKNQIKQI